MNGPQSILHKRFTEVYDALAEGLLGFVLYRVNDKSLTEDIVSDTFVRFWRKLSDGEEIKNEKALLYTIARGLIIDHYRKQNIRKHIPIDEVINSLAEKGSIIDELADKEEYSRVADALHEIKPEYADILILHYLKDFSISELADMMNVTENNLRVRLHRALDAVRKKLKHEKP